MQQSTNTMAVASLVLGIVALASLLTSGVFWGCVPLPLICGALAWSLGKNAVRQVDAGLGSPNDRGMATGGYVMGIIAVTLSLLVACCWVGVFAGGVGVMFYPIFRGGSF